MSLHELTDKEWHDNARKIIKERCPRCKYGAWEGTSIKCWHMYHPGYVGGYGSESAATCPQFEDTGKVGRIESVLRREG